MTPEEAHDIMFDAIFGSCTPVADATEVLLLELAKEREACAELAAETPTYGPTCEEAAEEIRKRV